MLEKRNYYLLLLILLILFFDCSTPKNDLQLEIQKIIKFQEAERSDGITDSTLIKLAEIDALIDNTVSVPDTIIAESAFRRGYYYLQTKQIDSASHYFYKTIALTNPDYTRDRELVYFRNAWDLEFSRENFTNVISIANDYITRLDINKDQRNLFYANFVLIQTYLEIGNIDEALEANNRSLIMSKSFPDNQNSTITSISKAQLLYINKNQKREAFHILDSLANREDITDEGRFQLYREYGVFKYYDSDFNNAVKNYKKSLLYLKRDTKRYNFNGEMLKAYLNIADAYVTWNKLDEAKKYIDSSKVYIDVNTTFDNRKFFGEVNLAYNYYLNNDFENVLNDYRNLTNVQDELHNKTIDEKLIAYESSKANERILSDQNKQRQVDNLRLKSRQKFLLIILLLLIIIGYLFFRQRKLRFEKSSLQMQQRLLRAQMNPHFTFNALSTIQNYVKTNQEKATNYLLKLSRLLRLILENSIQNYVQLEDELELLKKYMDLQLLRFPDKFLYNINLEGLEEDDLIFIPPMLMQPFIENSIEHGFLGINYQGRIDIELILEEKYLNCTISDNGSGLQNNEDENNRSTSTKLISDFIYKTTKSKVSIVNKKSLSNLETGVKVNFLIPFKYTEND